MEKFHHAKSRLGKAAASPVKMRLFQHPLGDKVIDVEPHHIRRISDGGPDDPSFVVALCPNCHRRVHAGMDGHDYNSNLLVAMASIEPK
jgi:HNH endonuclease